MHPRAARARNLDRGTSITNMWLILNQNSMNNRANIMYFIEHLCDMAQRENHLNFVRMMQKDILMVVDAVAPSDGSGAANVKVVRRVRSTVHGAGDSLEVTLIQVLQGLQQKNVLQQDTVAEIEGCLKERDAEQPLSPIDANGQQEHPQNHTANAKVNGLSRPDKRQIEQRIEEDRERHKRLRESIWAIGDDGDQEFERLWDDVSDIGEDDYIAAEEDAVERRQALGVDA